VGRISVHNIKKKTKKPALKLVLPMTPVLGRPVVQPRACFRQLRPAKLPAVQENRHRDVMCLSRGQRSQRWQGQELAPNFVEVPLGKLG